MLISMTGHGQALLQDGPNQVFVEIRSVNNRFLKINVIGELSADQSAEIEQVVRQSVKRGTVAVRIVTDRAHDPNQFRINVVALAAYRRQFAEHFPDEPLPLAALVTLPGIVEEHWVGQINELWPTICQALEKAIEQWNDMRRREGLTMRDSLSAHVMELSTCLAQIADRAPQVIQNYRTRLSERISQWLTDQGIVGSHSDLVREVGLFAERADIAEEVVRMKSHLQQCQATINCSESAGRKLDFLTQELLREANTIGSKSNDAMIAQLVVEMKSIIERMRELVQNVE